MVYVIDELPGFTRLGELTVAAHPALVGNEDSRINTSQYRIGQFGESASLLGGANGVMLLELGRF